jgi:hypothetical protein
VNGATVSVDGGMVKALPDMRPVAAVIGQRPRRTARAAASRLPGWRRDRRGGRADGLTVAELAERLAPAEARGSHPLTTRLRDGTR